MLNVFKYLKFGVIASVGLIIALMLSACGGSSSPSTNNRLQNIESNQPVPSTGQITPIIETDTLQVFGKQQYPSRSAVGFALLSKGNAVIESVNWTQVSGEPVTILAANSQTIGFDVSNSGSYSLQAEVVLTNSSQTYLVNVPFTVRNDIADANVRLDHSVTELGKVSLHAGATAGKTITNVTWTQEAGPQAQNIETTNAFLFFDAPNVTQDSVIAYTANISYADGTSGSDDVLVTVKNVAFDTEGLFANNNSVITEDLFVYKPNSPFKSAVERCVYNNNIPATPDCRFSELPLIGSYTNGLTPSIEQILDRTLVSHAWMGQRFEEYLQNSSAGEDMRNLLRGVTAIVISYEVRPSFYWAATGAIYLDANNFWQSPEERDTLNDAPDFRSSFGSDLKFRVFWRYTKDNQYYPSGSYAKQDRTNRSFSDVEASISWLMYHELAHANDFFPASSWASINPGNTPLSYFNNNGTNSDVLDLQYPLRSDEMHALAQVRFRNETASQTQMNYGADDVAQFFAPDIAPSFYAYLTTREDYATLFERYMMLYRLDSEADVAIVNTDNNDDFIVSWGQRNRITAPGLNDRAAFVVERVYPELDDVRTQLSNLPGPILMDTSLGWFDNLDLSEDFSTQNRKNTKALTKEQRIKQSQLDATYIHEHRFLQP